MPPRQPPTPPALIAMSTTSALAAGWAAIAIVAAGRAAAGVPAGVTWRRFELAPPYYLMRAVTDGTPSSAPGWLLVTFGGAALLIGVAFLVRGLVGLTRSKGWLRSGALALVLVALTWVPTLLVAGALRRGARGGPVGELYQALGDPQAGRWAAVALGLLALWLAAGAAARLTVTTGRTWIRADTMVFRRRLVRVVAGYSTGIAMAAVAVLLGWMAIVPAVLWAATILIFVVARTA